MSRHIVSSGRADNPHVRGWSTIAAPVLLMLFAAAAVAACGGQSPSVLTPTSIQGMETMSGPAIAPHSSICWPFNNAKAGPVSADVTPRSIHVVLGAGTCSAPGAILAERDGEVVNADAPAGTNHVTLSNPSYVYVPYTLHDTHWY
jgi:hypothetical protein